MDKLSRKKRNMIEHWQIISILLVVYDVLAVNAAFGGALWLRYDCSFSHIDRAFLSAFARFAPIYTVCCIAVFFAFKMYNSLWRYASYRELLHVAEATGVTFIIQLLGITLLFRRMPVSYYVFGIVIQLVLTLGIRFAYRFVLLMRSRNSRGNLRYRCAIYGAGDAGLSILRDIVNGDKDKEDKIVCFFDDNSNKWGRYIEGIPVYGGAESVFEAVEKFGLDKIFFAIPSATPEERRDILQILTETDCQIKQLPGLYELIGSKVNSGDLKDVPVEDLLGRRPIKADMSGVYDYIHGKTVLVTGGGGSIGSELCRQIAGHSPKQLIIFDIYENNAYAIQLELKEKYPELDLVTLIGSVRDSRRVNYVFDKYRPDVVYHAAAHKHVPLMEDSPCESIKNNVFGTYKCCYAAMKYGCSRFVLISTDKAVNPTNIMGASKRLCEMVVQTFDRLVSSGRSDLLPQFYTHAECKLRASSSMLQGDLAGTPSPLAACSLQLAADEPLAARRSPLAAPNTSYVAVRFGNVLGSNGSVVPIFKKQIEKGGPVTVTHPDIIRYFMTVPEAVSLVMLAGTYAKGGEIFVLDMGSPVKIDTLARNLIRLSGLKPDVDIKIEYTGLRPGEKLYEEKLMAEEGLEKTDNDLIHIGKPIAFDTDVFLTQLEKLENMAYDNDEANIRACVREAVVTYHPLN